jgi:anti-anti-sigma factor
VTTLNQGALASGRRERPLWETRPVALGTRLLWFGRTLWIELHGVLNWCTADLFRQHLQLGMVRPCRRVVADLTDLEYVGGNGLHALLKLQEELAARGVELRLAVPEGSSCARTIALAKLQGVLRTFAQPAGAWRYRDRAPHAAC